MSIGTCRSTVPVRLALTSPLGSSFYAYLGVCKLVDTAHGMLERRASNATRPHFKSLKGLGFPSDRPRRPRAPSFPSRRSLAARTDLWFSGLAPPVLRPWILAAPSLMTLLLGYSVLSVFLFSGYITSNPWPVILSASTPTNGKSSRVSALLRLNRCNM